MKSIKFFILILVGMFIFTGCNNNEYLITINYKEFKEMQKSEKDFFVEFVQDGCSYCTAFTPKLKKVLTDYEIKGYQLNISELTDEEYQEINLKFGSFGTPTTIFFIEGRELSKLQRISGNASSKKIISKLEANGYIKNNSK